MSKKKFLEANFQSKLIEDFKFGGFRAKKMPSGMGVTVVDLYVTHEIYGAFWIELKALTSVNQKVPITELQRRDIKAELKHGGRSACLVRVRTPKTPSIEDLYLLDIEEDYVHEKLKIATRRLGEKWPVNSIADRLIVESKRYRLRRCQTQHDVLGDAQGGVRSGIEVPPAANSEPDGT